MMRWAGIVAWLPAVALAGCGEHDSRSTVVAPPAGPAVAYYEPSGSYEQRGYPERREYQPYQPAGTVPEPIYEPVPEGYGMGSSGGEDADYYDEYEGGVQYDYRQSPIYIEQDEPAVESSTAEVNLQFFYENLAPYGDWVRHRQYGWVWYPTDVSPDWRPYTQGRWVLTEEYGWMWVSQEPWGWAPFHYGRWALDPVHGWIWVPGRVWAPAWVAWRASDEYVGWAPLPPQAIWQPERGLVFQGNISVERLSPERWVFVPQRRFVAEDVQRYVVAEPRNVTLVHVTNNTTNIVNVNNRIVNRSVDVRRIELVTRERIRPVRVQAVNNVNVVQREKIQGDTVQVFRPRVQRVTAEAEPAPPAEIIKKSQQDVGQQIERQRQRIQERERLTRERLEREQVEERQNAKGNPQELQQRQEQERRALERTTQRQRQVLERQAVEPTQRAEPVTGPRDRTREQRAPATQPGAGGPEGRTQVRPPAQEPPRARPQTRPAEPAQPQRTPPRTEPRAQEQREGPAAQPTPASPPSERAPAPRERSDRERVAPREDRDRAAPGVTTPTPSEPPRIGEPAVPARPEATPARPPTPEAKSPTATPARPDQRPDRSPGLGGAQGRPEKPQPQVPSGPRPDDRLSPADQSPPPAAKPAERSSAGPTAKPDDRDAKDKADRAKAADRPERPVPPASPADRDKAADRARPEPRAVPPKEPDKEKKDQKDRKSPATQPDRS